MAMRWNRFCHQPVPPVNVVLAKSFKGKMTEKFINILI